MAKPLHNWSAAFAVMLAGTIVSYAWIDRPLAYFVHDHVTNKLIFDLLQRIPDIFPALAAVTFAICAINVLIGRRRSHTETVALMASVSFAAARLVNTQLKFAFGRTWPETWIGNPSLIADGVYGFNPFHGGEGFASFPSGHAVASCAVAAVLWLYWPRLRPLYALAVAAVFIGLIGADYHFLSDVIAGAFFGVLAGWVTARIWPPVTAS